MQGREDVKMRQKIGRCNGPGGSVKKAAVRTERKAPTAADLRPAISGAYAFGSRTTKRAPMVLPLAPRRFSAAMRPRNASTICRQIDSPRPEC